MQYAIRLRCQRRLDLPKATMTMDEDPYPTARTKRTWVPCHHSPSHSGWETGRGQEEREHRRVGSNKGEIPAKKKRKDYGIEPRYQYYGHCFQLERLLHGQCTPIAMGRQPCDMPWCCITLLEKERRNWPVQGKSHPGILGLVTMQCGIADCSLVAEWYAKRPREVGMHNTNL